MVVKNNIISGFCAMGNLLEGGKGDQLLLSAGGIMLGSTQQRV